MSRTIPAAAEAELTHIQRAELAGDREQVGLLLQEWLQMYESLPESIDQLTTAPPGRIDPWGNVYRIQSRDDQLGFAIISNGPDGIPDTEDDISLTDDERLRPDGHDH